MGTYTLAFDDARECDSTVAGGKGANLVELTAAGFPVPSGFVVTTSAYADFVQASELGDGDPETLRENIPLLPLPEEIATPILDSYRALGSPPVAVRSSGTAEDLTDASFAGQHDTYLNVTGEQAVLDAVRDCWASLWTPRAVAYRERNHWADSGLALAVVVQEMVEAQWAGVVFTADPVTGRRDRVVLEAVHGLGEALVSGEASGEHITADKATGAPLPGDFDLPREALAELVRLGVDAESAFGRAQDIEWTYADGACALVQARPLTALPEDPGGAPETSAGNSGGRPGALTKNLLFVADHVPHPPYPIDWSVSLRPTLDAVLKGLRKAGLTNAKLDDVLVQIAGADSGVVQAIPPRLRPTMSSVLGIPRMAGKVLASMRTTPTKWREECDATLIPLVERLDGTSLAALSDQELLDAIESVRRAQAPLLGSRFACVLPRGIASEQLLLVLLRRSVGATRAERLHTELLAGVDCKTREATLHLQRLAAMVTADPELRAVYDEQEPRAIAGRLREFAAGRALLDEVETYLASYGCRQMAMPMIGFPPLRENPHVLHSMLAGLSRAERGGGGSGSDDQTSAEAALKELAAVTGYRRVFAALAARLVPIVRNAISVREDSHFYLFMAGSAASRRMLLEFGRRLVERGALAEAADACYLRFDELRMGTPANVADIVARRREARASVADSYTFFPAELLHTGSSKSGLHGVPASSGTATGKVRIVRGEEDFGALAEGEILVCPYTNPAWTALFSLARAVVADTGGAASHAAIVAREYGIPAVMATGNGTGVLTDGQLVRVDGGGGTVVPVASPS